MRQSLRNLSRTPAFTAAALITLTLGIGANTAIFSVVNAVFITPLPYPSPERLVLLGYTFSGRSAWASSPAKYVVWRETATVFDDLSAVRFRQVSRTDGPEPEVLASGHVNADFFRLLGARFALGRPFTAEEDGPGSDRVILSHRLWEQQLGGRQDILGTTIGIDGRPREVVGVLAADFDTAIFNASPLVWLPIQIDPATTDQPPSLRALARLKPDVTLDVAQAQARQVADAFRSKFPKAMDPGDTLIVEPFNDVLVSPVRSVLLVLSAAVTFVLLIACANAANLMLIRASIRQPEIAIRLALGAGRRRIARHLLTESVILSVAAGGLGVMVGVLVSRGMVRLYPGVIPRIGSDANEIGLDWRVLLFTLLTSIGTAVVFGLLPVLQAMNTNLTQAWWRTRRGPLRSEEPGVCARRS